LEAGERPERGRREAAAVLRWRLPKSTDTAAPAHPARPCPSSPPLPIQPAPAHPGAALFPLIVAEAHATSPRLALCLPLLCSAAGGEEPRVLSRCGEAREEVVAQERLSTVLSHGSDTREAMAIEAVAKARWLRRLESVRRVGAVRQFGAAAAPPVSATAPVSSAEYSEDGAVHRGIDNGQYRRQDGTMHWLREGFGRQYSGEDQQSMAALGKRGWERSDLSFSTPTPNLNPSPTLNPEPRPYPGH